MKRIIITLDFTLFGNLTIKTDFQYYAYSTQFRIRDIHNLLVVQKMEMTDFIGEDR